MLRLVLPVLCAAASAADVVVPLPVFAAAPGSEFQVGDQRRRADAPGLALPAGTRVHLAWRDAQGVAREIDLVAVDAASGAMAPDWAHAEPVRQADGSCIAVGYASGGELRLAQDMARAGALREAMRAKAVGSTTTTTTTATADSAGGMTTSSSETVTRTTGNGSVRVLEMLVTVSADAATAPPLPPPPAGASARPPVHEPTRGPLVRCWVKAAVAGGR